MRIALRLLVVVVLLVVVAIGALLVLMPRLVRSEAVRSRIEAAARDALGRDLHYGELDFGLFPPSLLVEEPSVAGARPSDPPFVEAKTVALRVALIPLFSREVVVDSLLIDGPVVRLLRTAEGIEVPGAPSRGERKAQAPAPPPPAPEGSEAPTSEGARVNLAVRGFSLRRGLVVFEDRVVSPANQIEIRDLDVNARIESLDEPIEFDASAKLSGGGDVSARGTATLDGILDLQLLLDAVDLSPAKPYLGKSLGVDGAVTGKVTAQGPAASPTSLRADLSVQKARIAMNEIAVDGPLGLVAELEGALATPKGRFEVNATDAALRYGDAFDKPPGKPATVTGRIVTGRDGKAEVDDLNLQVGPTRAQGRVSIGPRTRVVARVEPFDVSGWNEMVPALARYRLQGPVRMDEFTVLTSPLDVRGAIHLDSLQGQVPDRGPIVVKGDIVADGSRIRSKDLTVDSAGQKVDLDFDLSGLGGKLAYRVEAQTHDADTNQLVSAFTSRRDTFFGLLGFDGTVSGKLGDGPPLQFAQGRSKLDIRDGKVVGLSLIQSLFSGLGTKGQAAAGVAGIALDVAQVFTGRNLERFYGENFDSLTGTFRLASGVASTDDLRLVYQDYTAALKGRFDLNDGKFDLQAVLTLGQAVDQALGAAPAEGKKPLVIPVPVRGSLDQPFRIGVNPTLDITPEVVTLVAGRYLSREVEEVSKLKQKGKSEIDKALGEGAGDVAEDIIRQVPGLGGLLGGERRPPTQNPQTPPIVPPTTPPGDPPTNP